MQYSRGLKAELEEWLDILALRFMELADVSTVDPTVDPTDLTTDHLASAVISGNIHVIEYVAKITPCNNISEYAAFHGESDVLAWSPISHTRTPSISTAAIIGDNTEVLKWLHDNMYLNEYEAVATAARTGNIRMLQFLSELGCYYTSRSIFSAAVSGGSISAMQWLLDHGCEMDPVSSELAASNGNIDILQWLIEHGRRVDSSTCSAAAKYGHLETLQWLRAQGCEWTESVLHDAACGGYLDMLKWCVGEGLKCNIITFEKAAMGGHIHVMEWLLNEGCEWGVKVTNAAAYSSSASMEWLLDRGCPIDISAIKTATRWDRLDIIKLLSTRMIIPRDLIYYALEVDCTQIVEYLHDNGIEWSVDMAICAVRYDNLRQLKWLVDKGCPVNSAVIEKAEHYCNTDIVQYLHGLGVSE